MTLSIRALVPTPESEKLISLSLLRRDIWSLPRQGGVDEFKRCGSGKVRAEQQGKPVARQQAAHTEYCRMEREAKVGLSIEGILNAESRRAIAEKHM
jgi:hypothetical protein